MALKQSNKICHKADELWLGVPVQSPIQDHNELRPPFFMTLFYHILIEPIRQGLTNLLDSSD